MGEALRGAGLAFRGLRSWSSSPRLMLMGLVPGAVTFVLLIAALIVFGTQVFGWSGALASWLVDEGSGWHSVLRLLLMAAMLVSAALIAIYSFTVVTLAIGGPFFERIARAVDRETDVGRVESVGGMLRRSCLDSVRLGLLTVPVAAALFLVGFVPVVGGIVALAAGASIGGWFLALELTTAPLAARGVVTLAHRRRFLKARRPLVLGYGVTVYVTFLLPLGALLGMPAAVAGATLLVRRIEDEAGEEGEPARR